MIRIQQQNRQKKENNSPVFRILLLVHDLLWHPPLQLRLQQFVYLALLPSAPPLYCHQQSTHSPTYFSTFLHWLVHRNKINGRQFLEVCKSMNIIEFLSQHFTITWPTSFQCNTISINPHKFLNTTYSTTVFGATVCKTVYRYSMLLNRCLSCPVCRYRWCGLAK